MAEGVLWYKPVPRWGHVAAAVEGKLYVWGGLRRDLPAVHDGLTKIAVTSVVDILDPQVIIIITYIGCQVADKGCTNEFHCFTSGEHTQYTHHSVR